MAKLTSGRVKKTPQSGLSSDRYQFLGLDQAEPNLGDPLIGPSSIGANPIKVGSFYQLAAIGEYPGERYWSTQVGIGTTLGIISVYANGELPNNAFGRIHGLNFVGTGVTLETPSVDFIGDVGIATVRFTVTDILNQGAPGQVLYNGPNGLALGSPDLNYYNGNIGIGTSQPTNSKLEVIGDVFISGVITASNFYGNLSGTATTATNVIGGISSVTSLSVSGISTLGNIKISSGIITATTGTATYYGNLIGNADYATVAGFAYTTYADTAGFSTTSGISTSVIGGIASVTSLRVSGISTLGITSTTQLTTQSLIVSGSSTLGFITATDAFYTGVITATRFDGIVDGFIENAEYAIKSGVSTDVVGGIASVSSLSVSGVSTLGNVYVNNTISGPSIIYIDPTVVGDDTGKVVIKGDLEVKGTTTTIESQTLIVADKNIELATGSSSDSISDEGGITLKGTTDHTIIFKDIDDAWQFSENLTPSLDSSKDLGISSKKWRTLYVNNVYTNYTSTADLNVSGVSTLGITSTTQLTAQRLNVSGVSTLGFITATDAFYTGVVTATRFYGIVDGFVDSAVYATNAGVSTDVIGGIGSLTSLSVSGITTLGTVQISSGIITSSTGGIVTYYGDGSKLTGISTTSAISISTNTTNQSQYLTYATGTGSTTGLGITTTGLVFNPSTGNLGIGTTNPTEVLDVFGNISIGTNGLEVATISRKNSNSAIVIGGGKLSRQSTGANIELYGSTHPIWPHQAYYDASVHTFRNNFVEPVPVIYASISTSTSYFNNSVGIGTTNPTSKLQVAGNITPSQDSTYDLGSSDLHWNNLYVGIVTANEYYGTFKGTIDSEVTLDKADYATNAGIATNIKGGSASQIPYQTGANATAFIPNGTSGQLLQSNGTSAPSWVTATDLSVSNAAYATNAGIATNLEGGGAGTLVYQSQTGVTTFLADPNVEGRILTWSNINNVPQWSDPATTSLGAASTISILSDTSNANQYLTYVTGVGNTTLGVSTTTTALTFNPSTGRLGIGSTNPQGALDINVGSATTINFGNHKLISGPSSSLILGIGNTLSANAHPQYVIGNSNNISGSVTTNMVFGYSNGITFNGGNNFVYGHANTSTLGSSAMVFGNSNTSIISASIGTNNIIVGNSNTGITSASNNIIIGFNQSLPISTGTASDQSNQLVIGAGNTAWIYGNSSYNIGIGTTNPGEKLQVDGNLSINGTTSYGSTTATTATVSQTNIYSSLSASTYRSVEYTIQATQGTNYHATKILTVHNGTTAYNSEYGIVYNNTLVGAFDVDISGGNIRLLVTPASSSSTSYTINFVATKI